MQNQLGIRAADFTSLILCRVSPAVTQNADDFEHFVTDDLSVLEPVRERQEAVATKNHRIRGGNSMRAAVAGLAFAAASSSSAAAATVSHFESKEGKEVVTLSGEIQPGDAAQLVAAIQAANTDGRLVSGVRLNSSGGNLVEGIKLADTIRYAKVALVVVNGTTCASACFVVFAAGAEKYVSYSAAVGVHGASANGHET